MPGAGISTRPSATRSRGKPVIREHRIPTQGSKPCIAVEGPDGNLWFCENGASKIGVLIAEYDIPTPASGARCIVATTDGRLFFTQYDSGLIGEIVP
jgi:virginiamycin B lyase